jgi:hypothetical protein
MVRCSFIFWQKLDITPDGETYVRYYKVLVRWLCNDEWGVFFPVHQKYRKVLLARHQFHVESR